MPWAIKWRSNCKLDGERSYLIGKFYAQDPIPERMDGYVTMCFRTRQQARKFVKDRFGYLKNRPDLKAAPHGWKMPQVVKVKVTVKEV